MASQAYIGAVFMFAGNFAPRGYMLCQGQLLSIQQNAALFSILGTMYGGNGTTTFGLPDLRGRGPVGVGSGPGLSTVVEGQISGTENITLNSTNMPAHNHMINASAAAGASASPQNNLIGVPVDSTGTPGTGFNPAPGNATLSPTAVSMAGGNQPVGIRNPMLGLNFIICTQGLFPSRN